MNSLIPSQFNGAALRISRPWRGSRSLMTPDACNMKSRTWSREIFTTLGYQHGISKALERHLWQLLPVPRHLVSNLGSSIFCCLMSSCADPTKTSISALFTGWREVSEVKPRSEGKVKVLDEVLAGIRNMKNADGADNKSEWICL